MVGKLTALVVAGVRSGVSGLEVME